MLNQLYLASINSQASRLKNQFGGASVNFLVGELFFTTAITCKNLCPYSKIAVLYTQQDFLEFGESFTYIIKRNGLNPVNVIISELELQNDERLAKSLPENVRLIATLSGAHIYNAQALAFEMGIACVIGLNKTPERLFNSLNLPNVNFVLAERLNFTAYETYQNLVNKIITLLDIKLKQFFRITRKNFSLADEFSQSLDIALKLSCKSQDYAQKLLYYALLLELTGVALGQLSNGYDVKTALCILKLSATNLKREFFRVPNYLERAQAIGELYGANRLEILENLKSQLEYQNAFSEKLTDIKKGLAALASVYLERQNEIIENFKSFNGVANKKAKEILQTVKYAGDLHYYNNIVSLLRETGSLEIKV